MTAAPLLPPVVFPRHPRPRVGIVVVTYGRGDLAVGALRAVAAHTTVPYEVVIVDNASPDGTGDLLEDVVVGATILRNDTNHGFGLANDQGVAALGAPLVCLLNSDTEVQTGWLEPLVEALERPGVGVAVPLLLHPDGTVQEAGSVLRRDGTTAAVGDGADPDDPAVAFGRAVTYGSAACLLLRRADFERLGGFDAAYGAAYYEDVDLALGLAALGRTTWYEPRSRVVHVRGASTDGGRASALMRANQARLVARWSDALAVLPRPGTAPAPLGIGAPAPERLLLIDDRVPNRDRGSGDPRMALLLDELRASWPDVAVTLLARDPLRAAEYAAFLADRGVEVVWDVDWPAWFRSRRGVYSAVVVSRPSNFAAARALIEETQPQAVRVYDAESLFFRRLELQLRHTPAAGRAAVAAELEHTRALEVTAIGWADVVLAVSEEAARVAADVHPGVPVVILGHAVDPPARVRGRDERRDLVFFGGFMAGPGGPNEDAACRAAREVLPEVRRHRPDVDLVVVGADPTPAVLDLDGDGVRVVGPVDDPQAALGAALVHVCPLRFGAGLKLRFVDTMVAGLPFVTSSVGAQDLGLTAELEALLVHDHPRRQAALALDLLDDPGRWTAVSSALVAHAAERFSRAAFRASLAEALATLGIPVPRGGLVPAPAARSASGALVAAAPD